MAYNCLSSELSVGLSLIKPRKSIRKGNGDMYYSPVWLQFGSDFARSISLNIITLDRVYNSLV